MAESYGASSGYVSAPESLVRPLTEADVPWLRQLCLKRYSSRFDSYTTERWFVEICLKKPLIFYSVRTDDAFLIALLNTVPWLPAEMECNVIFLCAEPGKIWQTVALCRASIEWGKLRRATIWRLASDTDYDLAPIARRVGAKEIHPRWCVEWKP